MSTTEPTPQQVLDLPLDPGNDSGAANVRGYLVKLLAAVWTEGDGFSGKHPFGNSGWECDLYLPLARAGFIRDSEDEQKGNALILAAIESLGGAAS